MVKKDLKLVRKQGADLNKVFDVISILEEGGKLPKNYREHVLHGKYEGDYECHIEADLVMIYHYYEDILILRFIRIGSHSNVLDM
ncbi:MAG: type II toxin-antitoxin system YafQ family toxin [Clostridia bacterium]|nr:type II toxin-antitoxin system YafQ family toxin [Clostridia bacterium]